IAALTMAGLWAWISKILLTWWLGPRMPQVVGSGAMAVLRAMAQICLLSLEIPLLIRVTRGAAAKQLFVSKPVQCLAIFGHLVIGSRLITAIQTWAVAVRP